MSINEWQAQHEAAQSALLIIGSVGSIIGGIVAGWVKSVMRRAPPRKSRT